MAIDIRGDIGDKADYFYTLDDVKELWGDFDLSGEKFWPPDEFKRVVTSLPLSVPDSIKDFVDRALRARHPSDIVELNNGTRKALDKLTVKIYPDTEVIKGDMYRSFSPSDILFLDTVPLSDCIIKFNGFNDDIKENIQWECRVLTFNVDEGVPDFPNNEYSENIGGPVRLRGAAVLFRKNARIIYPFFIAEGDDSVLYLGSYMYGHDALFTRTWQADQEALHSMMFAWYGIQIALLHPTIKDVFAKPQMVVVQNSGSGKRRKNKPVRYIRRHVLNEEALKNEMYIDDKKHGISRKTMVWYVIGHWRHYKNGKVKFIKPYWKGPLRDTKNPGTVREREIVTDGISVDNSTESVHN